MSYKYDKQFLEELHNQQTETKYVRLIALDKNEIPIETIEGKATGGSINIDGASKKQRTCSGITLVSENMKAEYDINWALTHKFKVEIGLKNSIQPLYPDIIWLNQGVYGINNFSVSKNVNQCTVSISGQDKMGYLDGTFGGTIPMQVNFGVEDYVQPNGSIISTKIPLYKIIQQAVHSYGGEPLHNIVINDLDQSGYELWDYRGGSEDTTSTPIYYFYQDQNRVENMTFNGDMIVYSAEDGKAIALKDLEEETQLYIPNSNFNTGARFKLLNTTDAPLYKISRIEYGDSAGYHRTELTYAGDLILNAGETVTALLDKIVNMLGEYEYFYDLDGHFIFQKKKTYIQSLLTPINRGTTETFVNLSKYSYEFKDQTLTTQMSQSPNIKDIKNDFVVWGNRKNATGADTPIHLRLAVAHKPSTYVVPMNYYERQYIYNIDVILNETELPTGYIWYIKEYNYYRPATDAEIKEQKNLCYIKEGFGVNSQNIYYVKRDNKYYPFDITQPLYQRNTNTLAFEEYSFPTTSDENSTSDENPTTSDKEFSSELFSVAEMEKVKYVAYEYAEQYINTQDELTLIKLHDWRELLYIMARDYYQHHEEVDFGVKLQEANPWCVNGKTGYEAFYADLWGFWRSLYNPDWTGADDTRHTYITSGKYQGWNRDAIYSPSSLLFWFDFIDTYGDLNQYSIDNIGIRTKVENKNDITSLFYEKTPEVEFIINPTETYSYQNDRDLSYSPLWIQDSVSELFAISGRGISASEHLNSLIYKYLCCAETVSITCRPIYYLEPNTRAYIFDADMNIDNDYLINKVTLPLSYNGTMSVSATKVVKNLDSTFFTPATEITLSNLLLVDMLGRYLRDTNGYYLQETTKEE